MLGRVGMGVSLLAIGLTVATATRQSRQFEVRALNIHASRDPAVIERGRYLVTGPGHCGDCHGASSGKEPGDDRSLSGGFAFQLPVGTFYAPNITPDTATGTGRYGDEDLARILRYGVRPDGTAVLPFMPTANLADDDLTAIVSYLRTLEPVGHAVKAHEVNALGRVVKAWLLTPPGPETTPAVHSPRGNTEENGRYLAHNVANCVACHTKMDMRTGQLVGPMFGGGAEHPSLSDPNQIYLSPNLTPDPRWGWIRGWDADAFSARLRSGVGRDGSPMPWRALSRLSDEDARAIHTYLQSVPQAEGGPDPRERDPLLKLARN